jgi:hypothetical protein
MWLQDAKCLLFFAKRLTQKEINLQSVVQTIWKQVSQDVHQHSSDEKNTERSHEDNEETCIRMIIEYALFIWFVSVLKDVMLLSVS